MGRATGKGGRFKRPLRNIAFELKKETSKSIKKNRKTKGAANKKLSDREKKNTGLYDKTDRILLVDEGNFSFARALCGSLKGNAGGVLATATEGKAELIAAYPEAAKVRKEIEAQGGTTLLGVDPTRLHKVSEFKAAFHKIVWLFPHIDTEETDFEKIAEMHQKLFSRFFKSAFKCLDPERGSAAIHVALTQGEPFKAWKLVQTAKDSCDQLEFRTAVPFNPDVWKGYERSAMFDPTEDERQANIYIFGVKNIRQYG